MPRKEYNGIKFDSAEECFLYEHFLEGNVHILKWLEHIRDVKVLDARPKSNVIIDWFRDRSWKKHQNRVYTADFIIECRLCEVTPSWDIIRKPKEKTTILVECKNPSNVLDGEYTLRRTSFLKRYHEDIDFAEIIVRRRVKKGEICPFKTQCEWRQYF